MTRALDGLADLVQRETGIRLADHQRPFLPVSYTHLTLPTTPYV